MDISCWNSFDTDHSGLLSIMMTISKEAPCMDRFGGGFQTAIGVSSKISPREIALTRLSTYKSFRT